MRNNSNSKRVFRYVVPFYVERADKVQKASLYSEIDNCISKAFTLTNKNIEKKMFNHVDNHSANNSDIFEYIWKQFDKSDKKTNIGDEWLWDDVNKLPKKLRYNLSENEKIYFRIKEAGLFTFRTGVNFFWYEVEFTGKENIKEEDLISFQNAFKELNRSNKVFEQCNKENNTKESEYKYIEFICAKWIVNEVLTKVFKTEEGFYIRYYAEVELTGENEKKAPDKSLLYAFLPCVAADSTLKDEQYELAYFLSNGYNKKYKHKDDLKYTMYQPFENVVWNISKAGCCGIAVGTDSGDFVVNGLANKIETSYFLLYILVLHQTYGLLHFANKIAKEMPACSQEYSDKQGALYDKIKDIQIEINSFLLRNVYTSVSHIQHHNEFYDYCIRKLDIEHDIKSVCMGLDAMEEVQRTYREECELRESKRKEKTISIPVRLLALLGIVSTSSNISTFFKEYNEKIEEAPLIWKWIYNLLNGKANWNILQETLQIILFLITLIILYFIVKDIGSSVIEWIRSRKRKRSKKQRKTCYD